MTARSRDRLATLVPLALVGPLLVALTGSAPAWAHAATPKAPQKARVTFEAGVLKVDGTDKDQKISVVRHKGRVVVRVGGKELKVPRAYKNRTAAAIRVRGFGGDDTVTVDPAGRALPPVRMVGGPGDDRLTGTSGDDVLDAGPGNDVLSPGPGGHDVLDGGPDPDTYLVDAARSGHARIVEVFEAPGDLVSFAPTPADRGVTYALGTDAHQVNGFYDVEDDRGGIEDLTGGAGDDTLVTGRGDNVVHGGPGNDRLAGSYQDDHDVLSGDAGDDVFGIYCTGPTARTDTITDFVPGTETVDMASGLSVKDGLGTTSVTIWDGVDVCDVVEAANGHLWGVGDFT
jgi:Ca2+-binding RTX toxin-like protein